ncbi:MAG: 50S ribosomal protein L29 [Patescibacteria group bacterium]
MDKTFQELKLKTPAELQKILRDDREKLRALQFDRIAGKVKNANEVGHVKKNIAQILTILNSPSVDNK